MTSFETFAELALGLWAALGLVLQSGILKGKKRKGMFCYYTNLSNLIVAFFFILRFLLRMLVDEEFHAGFLFHPLSFFTVSTTITVTFLIYHFALLPIYKKDDEKRKRIITFGNLSVHYFVPLLTLVMWFAYGQGEKLTFALALCWVILPFLYGVFIILRGITKSNIPGTDSPYPYFFMDSNKYSPIKLLRNYIYLFIGFVILAFILLGTKVLITKI